jgi:phosphomannomutase/phosphoglucomutase
MTLRLEPAIFREYDIRGVVERDLSPDRVEVIARGLGRRLRRGGGSVAIVGRDVRLTSEAYAAAARRGLQAAGLATVDLGVVPTPAFYFALEKEDPKALAGGIMITGSHNPPQYNGLKIAEGKRTLFGADIQEVRRLAEEEAAAPASSAKSAGGPQGTSRDILPAYIADIAGGIRLARPLHVVLDCGNGTGGLAAPEIFRRLGCETTVLFGEPDGRFPNHHPDPTVPANLTALRETVRATRADVGIAFDGDSDRIGAVDGDGGIIFGDYLLLLYALEILKKGPATILSDVKCSGVLFDQIREHGGTAAMWKTGHSLIKNRMKEIGAPLAGEMSGHIFFADRYYGYDDAIYAGARLAEIVAAGSEPLAARMARLPHPPSTPEIRMHVPEAHKFELVAALAQHYKSRHDVVDIDGARVNFGDGWGLVRASNTEPVVVLRFEAATPEALARIRGEVEGRLNAEIARLAGGAA